MADTDDVTLRIRKEAVMNRKFIFAISLASVLAAPATNVYAEGDDEKKPEQPQLLAEGDQRQDSIDLIILSEGDDSPRPIDRADLIILG
jgi:hypothetical protein